MNLYKPKFIISPGKIELTIQQIYHISPAQTEIVQPATYLSSYPYSPRSLSQQHVIAPQSVQ